MNKACKICGNSNQNNPYVAREMMFGFRDKFDYFECSKCGCLQIADIPENLEKYYPTNYYSFFEPKISKSNKIKRFLKRQRTCYYLSGKSIIGNIMVNIFDNPDIPSWVKTAGLNIDSKILDVGCGAGHLLVYSGRKASLT